MVKVDFDLSGVKIPKTVAGVKVPKKLRKKGKKLLAKAQSPQGREAIAAGLTIAGAVIAAKSRAKAARAEARTAAAGEQAAEDAERAAEAAAERAAAAGARVHAKVVRHPRAPGEPGIDRDFGPEIDRAITTGIEALQRFLAGRRPG